MILVVDDDKNIRLSLKLILERNEYEVTLAEGPKEAMQIVRNTSAVELVLMDMNYTRATGDYRQRMEGVFVKAAIKRGQKSLLILLSVSRLGRRPRRSSNDVKIRKSRPGAFS